VRIAVIHIRRAGWIGLLALVSVVGCNQPPAASTTTGSRRASAEPEVTLKAVPFADVEAAVNALKGKVVVIDFWATWCLPCKKEFPGLVELHRKHAENGVACVSVSIDEVEEKDSALKFLKDKNATFANFLVVEDDSKWKKKWAIGGIPVVLVYGQDGKLAKRFDNSNPDSQFTYSDVTRFVEGLVANPQAWKP
jgi:thiol-disulfide isomerase/thioredoxin